MLGVRRLALIGGVALLSGCASTAGLQPQPFPVPPPATPAPDASRVNIEPARSGVVETALALRGTPYRAGGDDLEGFDCSGFTRYVFAQHGIALPRLAADQYERGTPIHADDIVPGDLVFFATTEPGASHVGMAIGGGRFVHAPNERSHVRIDRLSARYWSQRYLGARRVTD